MYKEPVEIYTIIDLQKITKDSVIQNDIVIRGELIKELTGVEKIIGSLGIFNSTLDSLGKIKEITGDFWISNSSTISNINSLTKLEKVGGNVRLRYTNLKDLGHLAEVGGNLNLRDTPIEILRPLKYVGGNLFLPKRLQSIIDLSKITVKGKIRYWNDEKSKINIFSKEELGLTKFQDEVPLWKHQYIYSVNELSSANYSQRYFYEIFKQKFEQGIFLDIQGNDNYLFILLYDLLNDYFQHKNIQKLHEDFNVLEKFYPKIRGYTLSLIIDQYMKIKDYRNAWILMYNNNHYIGITTILEFEKNLQQDLLDGKLMVRLSGISHLTQFGQKNIESIIPFATRQLQLFEKERGKKFFDLFFINGKMYQNYEKSLFDGLSYMNNTRPRSFNDKYDVEYYKQFFSSVSEFEFYKTIDNQGTNLDYNPEITHVVEKAIFNQFRIILKQAEDIYRESIGMPKIGEGWISETELYYKIKTEFQKYKVIQHGSPSWLGRQHLDIYLPEINLGIEYQGIQHYEPVDFFGGQDSLDKTIERDKRKKEKCLINKCILIYVNENYNFEDIKSEIMKIINVHNTTL